MSSTSWDPLGGSAKSTAQSNGTSAPSEIIITHINTLQNWEDSLDRVDDRTTVLNGSDQSLESKFPYQPEINKKICLWNGNVWALDADVIVNTTNESMTETSGISGEIIARAGPALKNETAGLDPCKTGEVRMTKGHLLPAKFIIHTVGPRYNEKYQTAAENALHNCYRNAMQLAKENSLKTIAFSVIITEKRGFPSRLGAHIAIRTVRRFLEKFGSGLEQVIFCINSDVDLVLYRELLPQYFPRSKQEELESISKLPADTGNEIGETVIEERKIRINAFPSSFNESVVEIESNRDDVKGLLTRMEADKDEELKKRLQNTKTSSKEEEIRRLHQTYVYKAMHMDLSAYAKLGVFYHSGTDSTGRPILIFVAQNMPLVETEMENVFLYIVKTMEQLAGGSNATEYHIVYIHSNMSGRSKPSFSWVKRLYRIMNEAYGQWLKTFFVLHPTFWLKVVEGVSSIFASKSKVFDKVIYMDKLIDLYNLFGADQLKIPEDVIKYDEKINGKLSIANKKQSATSASVMNEDL